MVLEKVQYHLHAELNRRSVNCENDCDPMIDFLLELAYGSVA